MHSGHLGRHGLTHPAAQRQQGDHEDEDNTVHSRNDNKIPLKVP